MTKSMPNDFTSTLIRNFGTYPDHPRKYPTLRRFYPLWSTHCAEGRLWTECAYATRRLSKAALTLHIDAENTFVWSGRNAGAGSQGQCPAREESPEETPHRLGRSSHRGDWTIYSNHDVRYQRRAARSEGDVAATRATPERRGSLFATTYERDPDSRRKSLTPARSSCPTYLRWRTTKHSAGS